MKKNILILLALLLFITKISAIIVETPNLELFENALENIDQETLVLFDVDETLIVPKDLIMRSPVRDIFREIAKETINNPDIVDIEKYGKDYFLGQVLSKVKYEIVDPKIVTIIEALHKRKIKTIAFTKMFIGTCGAIPAMEDWRFIQLKDLNIDFSSAFPLFQKIEIEPLDKMIRPALFKQGILCANGQDKGPVLIGFLRNIDWVPSKVLFIDDRLDYLLNVEESLSNIGIEFVGFHYTAVESFPDIVDRDVARFQLMHLAKTGEWLSDREAAELINKNR